MCPRVYDEATKSLVSALCGGFGKPSAGHSNRWARCTWLLCVEPLWVGSLCVEPLRMEPLCVEPLCVESLCVEPLCVESLCVEPLWVGLLCVEPLWVSAASVLSCAASGGVKGIGRCEGRCPFF